MPANAIGWTATKDHGDGHPSVITVTLGAFEGHPQIYVNGNTSDEPRVPIWDERQLGDLIAGLIAAARQAGFDMETVELSGGIMDREI